MKGGRQSDAFAYVTDIMPTILEVTEVEYPADLAGRRIEPMRGRSMVELLSGAKEAIYSDADFVGGEMGDGKWMRQGAFKAVSVPPPYGTGAWQLFNVVDDPGEANDLSKAMSDKLDSLKSAWDRYAKDVGVVPPA